MRTANVVRWHGGPTVPADAPKVNVTFVQPDGETRTEVQALVGESLLQTAHRNDIDLEGACEGGTYGRLRMRGSASSCEFLPFH